MSGQSDWAGAPAQWTVDHGGQKRQRAEAVKVAANLFAAPAKRVASYVLCQDARHTNPGLSRRIEPGEGSMQ
jgi:hypothetical protein